MTSCKLGGYIYKWGEKIGLSDHFITKDKGPEIFNASKSYPVTDENFLYDDPFSIIGRGAIKLDDEGVWGEKFKLGFMVMSKKMDKETGEITKGCLMGIDVSEIGMEEIEYIHN